MASSAKPWLGLFLNALVYLRFRPAIRKFRRKVGYWPNVAFPVRYGERMMWRKVFDHNPDFTVFSDKLACKAYIAGRLPQARIPETLWTGTDVRMLPDELQDRPFVLKANHGCDFNYFHDGDRASFDVDRVARLTRRWLAEPFGQSDLQWGYKHARRILFAEERLYPSDSPSLIDLTIRASNGVPLLALADTDNKSARHRKGYFDMAGRRLGQLESNIGPDKRLAEDFTLPEAFQTAIEYTRVLSKGVDFARYDYLWDGRELYAGEITVYPAAGLSKWNPGLEGYVQSGWNMSASWFLNQPHRGLMRWYAEQLRRHFGLAGE